MAVIEDHESSARRVIEASSGGCAVRKHKPDQALAELLTGTVQISVSALGRRWGWSKATTHRWLIRWVREGHIVKRLGPGRTLELAPVVHRLRRSVDPSIDSLGPLKAVVSPERPASQGEDTWETVEARSVVRLGDAVRARSPFDQAPVVTLDSAVRRASPIALATLAVALALGCVSAGFSIDGLTAIFAGAFWPVVAMGATLELGKLVATAWLRHNWCSSTWFLRLVLMGMIAILMVLNGIGVFGFLVRAHLERQLALEVVVADRAADVDSRLLVESGVLSGLDKQIGQIDAAIEEMLRRGKLTTALALGSSLQQNRAQLSLRRQQQASLIAGLQVEKAKIATQARRAAADVGPVRYLAEAVAGPSVDLERVVRMLTLAIVAVFDPLAVALVVAAGSSK